MSWFVLSLITMLCWGCADLFYKKGTDEEDSQSHLKIAVWVGLIMGISALILLPFTETAFSFGSFLSGALKYSPASLSYILSMVIGYAGLRYLEVSIISPIQNASGAFSLIVMAVFFTVTGAMESFREEFAMIDIIGTVLIVAGVVALAFVEHKIHETLADK
ncbi:MAG: EamA family transporter, partial [Parasporobacterium sp.]|nr:EamA family transporter [Parasporobacterium sp.]